MQSYDALSTQIAIGSTISAMVLLNPDNSDVEFWPVRPALAAGCEVTSADEFALRKLRTVGVIGLCGPDARCAFKEHLEPQTVTAIGAAFQNYLRVLFGSSFAEQTRDAEIHELMRLMSLPDIRPNQGHRGLRASQ